VLDFFEGAGFETVLLDELEAGAGLDGAVFGGAGTERGSMRCCLGEAIQGV
jgi:hypothetical protein